MICLISEDDNSINYMEVEGKENQYTSLNIKDTGKVFYGDPGFPTKPAVTENRQNIPMGRKMFTQCAMSSPP
jgi:hypothetical protein